MEGSSSKLFVTSLLILLATSSSLVAMASPLSTEFIRTSCRSTTYPGLCFSSLSIHANLIQTSPRILASTALNVTLLSVRSTCSAMKELSKSRGMSHRVLGAMKDCVEVFGDAVDQLQRSIGQMGKLKGSNFQMFMSDIQTWVSAVLTNEDTCSEGFAGNAMNGKVKTIVRGRIVKVAQLTSNALALVNQFASLHG
ncbi:21 kDa protein-like [Corylus avellana]|uniref:21 kDa protein-like n=1 Tax=Corylus avellana TaxID=13451 RepID=UPI001E1FFB80|nr:21 kDa protein-like [Corylus avellana]